MNVRSQRGMSLAEVLVAVGMVSVMIFATLTVTMTSLKLTQNNQSEQFATQKAISMLDELKTVVQGNTTAGGVLTLDTYDNGLTNKPELTTQDVNSPADPISGNTLTAPGQWLYERRISVQKVGQANDVRLVNVKVFKNENGKQRLLAEVASVLRTLVSPMPPSQVYDVYVIAVENVPGWWVYMSNIVPFVRSAISDLQSRNPGLVIRTHWITKLSYGRDQLYRPYINSGDASTGSVSTAAVDWVYFYPGKMPATYPNDSSYSPGDDYYYPDSFFAAHMNRDGVDYQGYDAASNPYPYALADQYNNAMRYYDEQALYNSRAQAVDSDGKLLYPSEEKPLRLLLDDMSMDPDSYTNAIVMNLHGELLPFPPVRNYSDAAKDPTNYPNVRAVTHPERLRYDNNTANDANENVALRVYSYLSVPASNDGKTDFLGENTSGVSTAVPITVRIKGLSSWTPAAGSIKALQGGIGSTPNAYTAFADPGTTTQTTKMYYDAVVDSDGSTLIHLYNSPLKAPCVSSCAGGLNTSSRLYNMEYIPAPMEDLTASTSNQTGTTGPFTTDLSDSGNGPKNTARWRIVIPKAVCNDNAVITIETSIGKDSGGVSGTVYPTAYKPANMSRTYTWRGTDAWVFGDSTTSPATKAALPMTERFQFLGDPRHCPYADLKRPPVTKSTCQYKDSAAKCLENALGMGFNRYFDDFEASSTKDAGGSWPGWYYTTAAGVKLGVKHDGTYTNAGWATSDGYLDLDINRIDQVFRSALTRANAVYTTMTGFSYYYIGIGNEIGYDSANGFQYSVPVSSKPYDGTSSYFNESTIINDNGLTGTAKCKYGCGTKYIAEGDGTWWSISWLGELYPDDEYSKNSNWLTTGNLKTPNGTPKANTYVRKMRSGFPAALLPFGTVLIDTLKRTNAQGSTSFMWTGAQATSKVSATGFGHASKDGTNGSIQTDGTDVRNSYNFPLPDSIPNARPFSLTSGSSPVPDFYLDPEYGTPYVVNAMREFYTHDSDSLHASTLLSVTDPVTRDPAFIVVNGLSPTGTAGTTLISKWAFLSVLDSFLGARLYRDSGAGADNPADKHHVVQLPQLSITTPNETTNFKNPTSIPLAFTTTWKRWDSADYTLHPDPTAISPKYSGESVGLTYVLMYSIDNGKSWLYMRDDKVATIGVLPPTAYQSSAYADASPYTWNVSDATKFPTGTYLIRVEAYRSGLALHYSFHQYRFFLQRTP